MIADVAVIGAGLAGCAAAIEAARAGASVALLEKMPRAGGSSRISSGFFAFSETDDQRAAGIADTDAAFLDDLRRTGGGANQETLLLAFMQRQRDAHAWLKARGVRFDSIRATAGQSVPRTHRTDMRQLFDALEAEVRTQKLINLLPATAACRIDGLALRLADGGTVRARKAIVLTSGGFSRGESLLRDFAPLQAKAVRLGGAGNTGDGLRMAWALGAGFRDMGFIRGTFGCHPSARETGDPDAVRMPISAGGIAVNRAAKRFVDESRTYKEIGDACLRQDGAIAFQIFDTAMLAKGASGTGPLGLQTGIEAGWIISEPTQDALAHRLGLDAGALAETIDAYNADAAAGRDRQFGRATLVGGFGALAPVAVPPFLGYPCTSSILATYCGLTVDPDARVLDVFGAPVPGLYAAGEITGGFHGESYMAGTALAKALVFGRIAGATAAAA